MPTPTATIVPDTTCIDLTPALKKKKMTQLPGTPLPPPPFALMNQRNPAPARVTTDEENNNSKISYFVDSSKRTMNLVKLLRAKEVADKPTAAEKAGATRCLYNVPKVSREASPEPCSRADAIEGSKRTRKPRKKWLPALGPPEAESLRLLAKTASNGTWYCDNAELFSTISTLSRQ